MGNGKRRPTVTRHETTIAFIGLGNMGSPMAGRLVGAGLIVRGYDARVEVVDNFVRQHGGIGAASINEAITNADFVIAMLPDDAAVRAVMFDGDFDMLQRDGIAIDMGTSSPALTRAISARMAERAVAYVDAPVMGGVRFARDGTLEIMAGGEAAAIDRCQPIFAVLGHHTWRCGPSGSGHALKAIANFANAATFATFLEAMTIGRKFGLDASLMVAALQAMCTGRQHPLEKKIVPQVLTRKFTTGMAMGLIAKDVGIAANLARDIGARASIVEVTRALWDEAVDHYGKARDQTEVARLWEE